MFWKFVAKILAYVFLLMTLWVGVVAQVRKPLAMVTLSTENREPFAQYSIPSFIKYAERWGYDLYVFPMSLDISRPTPWSKIKAMLDLMKADEYEWYVWLDDDIYITNPNYQLIQCINDYGRQADLIVSAHKSLPTGPEDINSGLFLIRNSAWSREFLERVWDIGNYRYNKEVGSQWDQSAICELLATPAYRGSPLVVQLPGRVIQSQFTLLFKGDKGDYGQWQPGDFAAHLAGACTVVRADIMAQFANGVQGYPKVLKELEDRYIIEQ
jgi:hypothetical protein